MAIAHVNFEDVNIFSECINKLLEIVEEQSVIANTKLEGINELLSEEKEKAEKRIEENQRLKQILLQKIEEARQELDELYQQLAITPETIPDQVSCGTDEEGNDIYEEVEIPNPDYIALQNDISDVKARLEKLQALLDELESLTNQLCLEKDVIVNNETKLEGVASTLKAEFNVLVNTSSHAIELLNQIGVVLSVYINKKIEINIMSPNNEGCAFSANQSDGASRSAGPRMLTQTAQYWHSSGEIKTYDSPVETGLKLNCNQGVPKDRGGEGIAGFEGTCGLVSCENVLRMAGVDVTESDIIEYARTHRTGGIFHRRALCTIDREPEENGGTYAEDRQSILRAYGVESSIEYVDTNQLANYVGEGRGVIANVDANILWYGRQLSDNAYHAITVTSVVRDSISNQVYGFYICDSGSCNNDSARYVPAEVLETAMTATHGQVNVTRSIIR